MIYTLCDHIHQEKNGITFRRIVEVVPYTTVATYIPTRRGVKVELDAASDLFVDIDPGTDYLAEKTPSQADTASLSILRNMWLPAKIKGRAQSSKTYKFY
jgi:hypothetical protein